MTLLRIVAALIAAALSFIAITELATTFEDTSDTAALLALASLIVPFFVAFYVYKRTTASSTQAAIKTTRTPEEPKRDSDLTVARADPATPGSGIIDAYGPDGLVIDGESSGSIAAPANIPLQQEIPGFKQFAVGAILIGLCTYLAGSSLHMMPPWAVATCTFSMAVMIMLPRIYVRTLRRMHENQLFRKEGILYRFRTKRLILTATWFLLSICIAFYTLLQLNIMGAWEWAVLFLSCPVLYFVYIACYRFLAIHVDPRHICRISLSWTAALSPVILVCLFALMTWNVDQSAAAETLVQSVEAKRLHLATSNGSALVDESLLIVSAMAAARTYMEGKIGAVSVALSKSIHILNSLIIGYFSASLLSCLLIPRVEYRRLFGQATNAPIPKPIKPAKIAAWSAISAFVFGFIYLHGYAALETGVRQNPQWREEREKIEHIVFTEVDEIAGQYFTAGTIRQIQEARAKPLQASEAALALIGSQIDVAFLAMEGNVDGYLDWYYSLPAEYARIGLVLTGGVEDHLAGKLTEYLNRGEPFKRLSEQVALAISSSAEASKMFQEQKARILASNRISSTEGHFRVVSKISQTELDIPISHPTISNIEQRMTGAGAVGAVTGAVTAKAVSKVMGKSAFKLAVKGVSKIAVSKAGGGAAGAAAGAAIGSIFPGVGTAIGGVVGFGLGLAAGVAMDYALVNLEEVVSRDTFRAELISAINDAKTEFKSKRPNHDVLKILRIPRNLLAHGYVSEEIRRWRS